MKRNELFDKCVANCDPAIIEKVNREVDLEKELDQWRHQHFGGKRDEEYSGEYLERTSQLELARHFAQWQKEQMMKDAVEADVNTYRDIVGKSWAEFVVDMPTNHLGEKAKIIIVKDS